jgi:hypothetical protein
MNTAEQILTDLAALEAEIAAAPPAKSWNYFAAREQEEGRAHGPRWSAITGRAESDAERMRLTRALRGLEGAGLVECQRHQYCGRVRRVRLTESGQKAVAEVVAEGVP